jgi:hypothetical protein
MPGGQELAHASLGGSIDPRPSEAFPLCPSSGESSVDPLSDHGALELGEDAHHLEHGFARRRRRIDRLAMKVEVDTGAMDFPEEADEIL